MWASSLGYRRRFAWWRLCARPAESSPATPHEPVIRCALLEMNLLKFFASARGDNPCDLLDILPPESVHTQYPYLCTYSMFVCPMQMLEAVFKAHTMCSGYLISIAQCPFLRVHDLRNRYILCKAPVYQHAVETGVMPRRIVHMLTIILNQSSLAIFLLPLPPEMVHLCMMDVEDGI